MDNWGNLKDRLMFQMRIVLSFLIALGCTACSAMITADNYLGKDDKAIPVDLAAIDKNGWVETSQDKLQSIEVSHADGVLGHGIYLQTKNSKYVIVYFGGNMFRIRDEAPVLLPRFAPLDVDVVWFDYRGLGASDGIPTYDAIQSDAFDVLSYVSRLNKKVIVHGVSMGSLIAAKLSQDPRVDGMVLEGAISTAPELIHNMTPWWSTPFVKVELDGTLQHTSNFPAISAYKKSLLLLIGDRDTTTPVQFSKALYAASPSSRKSLTIVLGGQHGNVMKFDQSGAAYQTFLGTIN